MGHHDSPLRSSLAHARGAIAALSTLTGAESVPCAEGVGRVLAEPVFARFASPHYRAAAMDGIAVRAADTARALDGAPVLLGILTGDAEPSSQRAVCHPVDTGSALPAWADAVVRIEDTKRAGDGFEIRTPVSPGRDVRAIGEDIAAGDLLAGRGHTLRPLDLGALLASGVAAVTVRKPPLIGVIATGAEVIEPVDDERTTPAPGKVIEFNSRVLAAQAREWGALVEYLGRADDDAASLVRTLRREAARHDMLCVIAGSSAGRKDITVEALRTCGELVFHGVDVVPGRPAALARVDGKPVLAVPGYPVSAFVVYSELVRPAIDAALGRAASSPRALRAVVRSHIASRLGVEELVRVCLAFDGDSLVAATLPRGASMMGALVRAHGLVRIGPTTEGVAAGGQVDVELLDAGFDPARALVAGGRPDRLTAALAEALADGAPALEITHLGRAAHDALAALELGEVHLAVLDADEADQGDDERSSGGAAYRVTIPGHSPRLIRLSAALLASAAGARVCAALASEAMRAACVRQFRSEPAIERVR